ncbi:coiled-coil domain-containing protein 113-like isoform X2 [Bolinopsis microptera]|uniref:coiled-coil domain-containing protein 113-like isoform X2 n=1 Tax=Bolinopsis microptera TaxID=2820187 RepID=UPI00307ADFD0
MTSTGEGPSATGSSSISANTSQISLADQFARSTEEEIQFALDEIRNENDKLEKETGILTKYLKRVDPKDIQTQIKEASPVQQDVVRVHKRRSRSRTGSTERLLKLTTEQKCDIAQREHDELREEINKFKHETEKILDTYRATREEAEIRLAEMKKSSYEFNRDIVLGAKNLRTGRVVAERVTRYFEDKMRSRKALIEKLRLKNSTLKVQKKKLQLQLKQKEEMGEVLHEVDFKQLRIENNQYLEKIDERNQELLKLKHSSGNTLQVLNTYKKKLNNLTMESNRLKLEISQRNELLTKIDKETELVEKEREKAESINANLRRQLQDYIVPEVLDYVQVRADLYELTKTMKTWERKVDIAQMELQKYQKQWLMMREHNRTVNPWATMEQHAAL